MNRTTKLGDLVYACSDPQKKLEEEKQSAEVIPNDKGNEELKANEINET